MTTARRSAFMTAVVIISALTAGIAFGGVATALNADTAAPYPHSPGTTAAEFPVSVVAQSSDAITADGMKTMTLNFGADNRFDGDVQNVSADSIAVTVIGQDGQQTVGSYDLSTNGNGQVTLTFQRPVSVSPGDRIVADVSNMTTPSTDGDYAVGVSTSTPSGTTDGPVSVGYRVASAELTFPNQSASQFSGQQNVTVSGVIPNAGYVAVFTVADNGSRGQLVGSTDPIIAQYTPRTYTVSLNGNVEESQQLMAVAYYESSGISQSERLNGSFDANEDVAIQNNGQLANATGFVTTVDADGRVQAGSEYDQGARLYFSQGDPDVGYQLRAVEEGEPGATATQFETASNGTTTIDTSQLEQGQYVITRIDDGSIVSLDNDSTTSAQDDNIFVTGQTFTESTTGTASDNGGGDTGANATDGGGDAGGNDAGGNDSAGDAGDNQSGGDSGGESGAFGPGFGPVVAVVALLAAALFAARRDR